MYFLLLFIQHLSLAFPFSLETNHKMVIDKSWSEPKNLMEGFSYSKQMAEWWQNNFFFHFLHFLSPCLPTKEMGFMWSNLLDPPRTLLKFPLGSFHNLNWVILFPLPQISQSPDQNLTCPYVIYIISKTNSFLFP